MERVILCVFEGVKTEHRFFKSLESVYFDGHEVIKSSYGNNVFHLHQEMAEDDDPNSKKQICHPAPAQPPHRPL